MKTLTILCLAAAASLAGIAPLTASASDTVRVPVRSTTSAPPATVRINETVVITHRHHRRYRTVRRTYWRHGRRVVVTRQVYY